MALVTALPPAPAPAAETAASSTRARQAQRRRPKFGAVGGSHHPATLDTPVRLTRRGRLASRLGVVASIAVISFGMVQAVQPAASEYSAVRTVTVLPGQSLWTIAESSNPGVDPRVSVGAIRDANNLGSSSLVRPGTELEVPVLAVAR